MILVSVDNLRHDIRALEQYIYEGDTMQQKGLCMQIAVCRLLIAKDTAFILVAMLCNYLVNQHLYVKFPPLEQWIILHLMSVPFLLQIRHG